MDFRVAPQAESDLDDIWYFLATQSSSIDVADRVTDSITARFARGLDGSRKSVPKIVRARQLAGRRPNPGLTEERTHGATEAAPAIAAMAMPQERAVRPDGKSLLATQGEEAVDFTGSISRHRDQSRLVELRFPDHQRVLTRVVVAHSQPCQLTPSHSCRVEEDDREPHGLGTQRRIGRAHPPPGGGEQLADLLVREDVRPDSLVDRRKEALVRHKAAGLSAPAI